MSSSTPPQHDLGSLRIDDRSRPASKTGRRLGLFAASLGAVALAIVSDPTFLLCDEPTGDLDRKSADEIMEPTRVPLLILIKNSEP
ncbi:MAG TPA: hypothetical protein VN872_11080 [Candidatus Acidoferrum sp.]|nr:hypothetical protein [Candidatus Acidoferrum sp.]